MYFTASYIVTYINNSTISDLQCQIFFITASNVVYRFTLPVNNSSLVTLFMKGIEQPQQEVNFISQLN